MELAAVTRGSSRPREGVSEEVDKEVIGGHEFRQALADQVVLLLQQCLAALRPDLLRTHAVLESGCVPRRESCAAAGHS